MTPRFNLSNATPEQREGFFHALRIHAAGKDERRTYKRVQLAKVGDHPTGGTAERRPFTRDTFDAILASAGDAIPTVGISHKRPESNGLNGTPSLAPIHNLTIEPDPKTGVDALYGDIEGLPVWAAEEYPRRSVELMVYPDGRTVFTRLALLGDEAAAIPDLAPMPDGAELVAAAAVMGTIADATTSPSGAENPSPTGPEPIDTKEEPSMSLDTAVVARSLGLPEDADAATINKAAAEREAALLAEAEALTAHEAQETVEAPAVTEDALALTAAAALAPETVAQIQADAAELRRYRDQERQAILNAELDRVVKGGGFHEDTAAVYVTAAASDFDGTIARLKAHPLGIVAPLDGERGVSIEAAASADTSADDIYSAVYGEEG